MASWLFCSGLRLKGGKQDQGFTNPRLDSTSTFTIIGREKGPVSWSFLSWFMFIRMGSRTIGVYKLFSGTISQCKQ